MPALTHRHRRAYRQGVQVIVHKTDGATEVRDSKQAVPARDTRGHGRCCICNQPVYSFTTTCNGARTVDVVGL
jgi:hypothetical protein